MSLEGTLLVQQYVKIAFETSTNASHQLAYPDKTPGEPSVVGFPMDTGSAQRRSASCFNQATNEV